MERRADLVRGVVPSGLSEESTRLILGVRILRFFLAKADPGEGAVKSIALFKNTKQNLDLG